MSAVNVFRSKEPHGGGAPMHRPRKSSDSISPLMSPSIATKSSFSGRERTKSRTPPYSGYPRNSNSRGSQQSSLSKDSKGYSAEEKRKRYREEEQQRKLQQGSGYSPECYIFYLIILILLVGLLGFIAAAIWSTQPPKPRVKPQPAGYHYETNRHSMLIMSDNLDCSLYMKKLAMNKMELRAVIIGGLQCLHINEPHSVAPDSSFSLMYYFKHDRDAFSRQLAVGSKNEPCIMSKPEECTPYNLRTYYTSRVEVSARDFKEKSFSTEWMIYKDFYLDYYQPLFRRLARFSDTPNSDYQYPYPEILNVAPKYTEIKESTRIFRVSGLFDKMLKQATNITFSQNYKSLFKVTKKTRRKDKLIVTEKMARYLNHHYIYPVNSPLKLDFAHKLRLHAKPGRNQLIKHILYPDGATHSVISAFIVKVVYNYYLEYISPAPVSEAELLSWVVKAQKLAYHFFVSSREWRLSAQPPDRVASMMSRTGIAVKYLNGSLPDDLFAPTRKSVDRSVSIVAWERSDKEEIQVVGMSLPSLFESKFVIDDDKNKDDAQNDDQNFTSFHPTGRDISQPFSSHASLIIMESMNLDPDAEHVQIVASCSGSVRNAEAVATSVLYQLILNERPGKATWFGSIYYDIRNGKFYCDYEGVKNDYKRYTEHMEKVYKEAQKLAGIKCEKIEPDDFAANDRILMTASRRPPRTSHIINENPVMTGAIDPRMEDFNYAVGY